MNEVKFTSLSEPQSPHLENEIIIIASPSQVMARSKGDDADKLSEQGQAYS